VLGTLHTTGAVKTIDRIIDALPVEEREQTKSFLAQSLLAVVTQILVKTADGHGRKAVCEVLLMTRAIAKLIQTDQTHQIPTQLQMGRDVGMQRMDQALLGAIAARTIDPDDAYNYASEKRPFQKYVTDTSMLPKLDITGTVKSPAATSSAE
jgi:twitching motility protein PilT